MLFGVVGELRACDSPDELLLVVSFVASAKHSVSDGCVVMLEFFVTATAAPPPRAVAQAREAIPEI